MEPMTWRVVLSSAGMKPGDQSVMDSGQSLNLMLPVDSSDISHLMPFHSTMHSLVLALVQSG